MGETDKSPICDTWTPYIFSEEYLFDVNVDTTYT